MNKKLGVVSPEDPTNREKLVVKAILVKIAFLFILFSLFIITGCRGNKEADKNNGKSVSDSSTTDPGVVINGVTWATRNVDAPGTFAETPESVGMFYQWNRRKSWPSTGAISGWDASTPSGTEWESVNDPCPEGWRVPTRSEMENLEYSVSVGANTCTIVDGITVLTLISGANTITLPAPGGLDARAGQLITKIPFFDNKPFAFYGLSQCGVYGTITRGNRLNTWGGYHGTPGILVRCVRK